MLHFHPRWSINRKFTDISKSCGMLRPRWVVLQIVKQLFKVPNLRALCRENIGYWERSLTGQSQPRQPAICTERGKQLSYIFRSQCRRKPRHPRNCRGLSDLSTLHHSKSNTYGSDCWSHAPTSREYYDHGTRHVSWICDPTRTRLLLVCTTTGASVKVV